MPMKTLTGALLATLLATTGCEGLKLNLRKASVEERAAAYEKMVSQLNAKRKDQRGRTNRLDTSYYNDNDDKVDFDEGRIVTSQRDDNGNIYQFSEEFDNSERKKKEGTARVFVPKVAAKELPLLIPTPKETVNGNPTVSKEGITQNYQQKKYLLEGKDIATGSFKSLKELWENRNQIKQAETNPKANTNAEATAPVTERKDATSPFPLRRGSVKRAGDGDETSAAAGPVAKRRLIFNTDE